MKPELVFKPKSIRVKKVPDYCGLPVRTVYDLLKNKEVAYYKVGGRMMVELASLDKFLEKHRTATTAELQAMGRP